MQQRNLLAELESIGLEARIVDSHISILNRSGDEVVRLPLDALDRAGAAGATRSPERAVANATPKEQEPQVNEATPVANETPWRTILPADLLGSRD
jgi:hypothetical protein